MAEASAFEPFKNLRISSWEPLRRIQGRSPCPKCRKSRKFFCYSCYELVDLDPHDVPCLQLPVKIDIVKHKCEGEGKTTATHAKILAPGYVNIYEFPTKVPVYSDLSRVVLAFPHERSSTCEELAVKLKHNFVMNSKDVLMSNNAIKSHKIDFWESLDTIVFIDSTWQQTHQILMHEHIKCLQYVHLTGVETCFWRPQGKGSSHLATIEAIYYMLKHMDPLLTSRIYEGQFDDLLYFYSYQYGVVQSAINRNSTE